MISSPDTLGMTQTIIFNTISFNKKRLILFVLTVLILIPFKLYALEQKGVASWYGDKFQGKKTANGEIFNTNLYTAAHKTLPFNTIVTVTNPANGKSVDVRINDRGPFIEGRIIDLSFIAASELDIVKTGTAQVILTAKNIETLEPLYYIQVGAYTNLENAKKNFRLLKSLGIEPSAELTNTGVTRIVIKNLKKDELEPIVKKLAQVGHRNPLIKQH